MDQSLRELAARRRIATDYWDWQGVHRQVDDRTVAAVLAGLGVDCSTPEAAAQALGADWRAQLRATLPVVLVVRQSQPGGFPVHVVHGQPVRVWIELEDGTSRSDLAQLEDFTPPAQVDDTLIGQASFALPQGLPLGYHTLHAQAGQVAASCPLIVTPDRLPAVSGRSWGVAAQLYSVRSAGSWGIGDLADLADLGTWSGAEHGAGFVLINPLHAAAPVAPMEPSPYLPTSRSFLNPVYLRVERIPEYAALPVAGRAVVEDLLSGLRVWLAGVDRIDRDAVWAAKSRALELVHAVPRSAGRELAFGNYRRTEGAGLEDFATWCALAEAHGEDWRVWPEDLRDKGSAAVDDFRAGHRHRIDFWAWVQWVTDEQLAGAQLAVRRAGMPIGLMTDLAVGVDPGGADCWRLADVFAAGVTVGAPPDAFNQNGQNWSQPPWRPDRLAELAYAPFRDMVRAALRSAGGLRVDHILGLFRLWWIPAGAAPTEGTYVRYDHDAMVSILALEAHRAGAVVVGEDLGTVEPWVRDYLADRGILGTSILWFEFEYDGDGRPLRPERWRRGCLASVTTHDLPPTAGYLAGSHVRLREELGLLTRPLEVELAADTAERQSWLTELARRGLLPDGADAEQTIAALYRYLTLTPAALLAVALPDLVGDLRTQNQPGTIDEYPNWRVPLAGPDGHEVSLEELFVSPRAAALAEVLHVHPPR